MLVQPLQLNGAKIVSQKSNSMHGDSAIVRVIQMTRKPQAVFDALKNTDLRFSLVKPETSRLLVA